MYDTYDDYQNPYDDPTASQPGPPEAPPAPPAAPAAAAAPAGMMQQGSKADGSPRYVPAMPGYDAAHNPYGGSWQFDDAGSSWFWLPDKGNGRPANYAGGPLPTPRVGGVDPGATPPPGTPGTLTDPAYYSPFTGTAPTFTYKTFVRPPDFVKPTAEDAESDPGYQFVRDQGDQAFMQSAAAQGLSRSAGTLKGLSDYNRSAAATQYGNVYARAFGQYQNMVNNQLAYDTLDFSHADEGYQNSMREFLANRDTFYGNQSNPFNKLYSLASLGASTNN